MRFTGTSSTLPESVRGTSEIWWTSSGTWRGEHQLAHLVHNALAALVERLDRAAQHAALKFALVHRQQRAAADERCAYIRAPAGGEQPDVRAHLVIDPAKALRRQRRAGGAD